MPVLDCALGAGLDPGDGTQQRSDRVVALQLMPQRLVGVDRVVIPAALARVTQDLALLELRDDALHGALRDSNAGRDIAKPHIAIHRQADENVRVIG